MTRLDGGCVVVTGGASGIGEATVRAVVAGGGSAVIADLQDDRGRALASELGAAAVFHHTDVTREEDIAGAVDCAGETFGPLTGMVNNAGVTRTSNILDLTEKDWNWIHDVNAKGTFFCLQYAAKQMIKQKHGGRIINMASVGGKGFVDVSNAIYAASKGAVISLTKTAAQELSKYEITVNSICPGITHTSILSNIIKKRSLEQNKTETEIMNHYVRDIPLGRPNNPEDIAAMVVFLSSEGAKNISGQSYNIDGGLIPS